MAWSPNTPYYAYDDTAFRAAFPAFASIGTFPVSLLSMYWDQAGTIVANTSYGFLPQQGGPFALNLLTAHLAALNVQILNGENPAVATGAGIDKVSVTLMPPPYKNQFQYWLGTTPYGQQLMALLGAASVGGFMVPGGLGLAGFSSGPAGFGYCGGYY